MMPMACPGLMAWTDQVTRYSLYEIFTGCRDSRLHSLRQSLIRPLRVAKFQALLKHHDTP